ncbi:Aspyridones efflux protein-like protein 2 [Elsinoe fawcettii]|nr:Aspyridones efflux protein-like protein 2 [Elsinoe fawcettii]
MADRTRVSSLSTDGKSPPSAAHTSDHNTSMAASPAPTTLGSIKKFLNKKDNFAEAPPDGGLTSWLQVVGCALVFMNNWGLACSFGVYQAYYQLPTSSPNLVGRSPSSISWIGTTQAALTLIVGVASGPLFDRGFFFQTLVIASLLMCFSFMMLSLSTQYYQILLTQGILQGIAAGLLYIPSVAQIPQYFTTKRGTALGLVTAGGPLGGIIYPILFRSLITHHSFATATRVLGFVALATLSLSWLLIKPLRLRNAVQKKLLDPSILHDVPYLSFIAASFLLFCGMMSPYILSATYSFVQIDRLSPSALVSPSPAIVATVSESRDTAFYTVAIINAANFLGRALPAAASDYGLPGEYVLPVCTLALSALGFAWIAVRERASYYVFLVLYGFFSGGVASLPAVVLPYICPAMEVFATRLGLIYCAAGLGVLIGTPVGTAIDGLMEGRGDRFLGSQVWVGATMAVGLVFVVYTCYFVRRNRVAKSKGVQEVKDVQDVQDKA